LSLKTCDILVSPKRDIHNGTGTPWTFVRQAMYVPASVFIHVMIDPKAIYAQKVKKSKLFEKSLVLPLVNSAEAVRRDVGDPGWVNLQEL
jgi:hypothetical protein